MSVKDLFHVASIDGGKAAVTGFDNKMRAKKIRDAMNAEARAVLYKVTCGTDHIGPHGHGKCPMMRRQPMFGWDEIL